MLLDIFSHSRGDALGLLLPSEVMDCVMYVFVRSSLVLELID
jgi:hypothetical protein